MERYQGYLSKAKESFDFDVLHCHDLFPQAYLATLARESQEWRKLPLVLTSHGSDVMSGSTRYRNSVVRAKALSTVRSLDAMIAVSQTTKRDFQTLSSEAGGMLTPEIAEIPNGVDVELYETEQQLLAQLDGQLQSKDYLLFLGRFVKRKGLDLLLRAYAKLPPETRIPLVCAGYGREQGRLERYVRENQLQEFVHFVGPVSGEAKVSLYQHALATVIPTRTWEACSLVAIESLAAGTPILATRAPGLGSFVEEGVTGTLVDCDSEESLLRGLRRVLSQRDRMCQLASACRSSVREFAWHSVAKQHLKLYRQCIEKKNREYENV